MSALRLWRHVRHSGVPLILPQLQTVAHEEPARIPSPGKEAAPVMLTRFLKSASVARSRLAAFLDTSHKLYPDRLAFKHELTTLAITGFDGRHLHIGEGEYGQLYGVVPTKKR